MRYTNWFSVHNNTSRRRQEEANEIRRSWWSREIILKEIKIFLIPMRNWKSEVIIFKTDLDKTNLSLQHMIYNVWTWWDSCIGNDVKQAKPTRKWTASNCTYFFFFFSCVHLCPYWVLTNIWKNEKLKYPFNKKSYYLKVPKSKYFYVYLLLLSTKSLW